MAALLKGSPEEIQLLSDWLRADGVVALPTETVYGLAGNALSRLACKRIFEAKERPSWDPLIVHVASVEQARQIVEWSSEATRLADYFWPGPLTLILPGKGKVAREVTDGKKTVAVRMPAHPLFLEVLKASGLPLAAPSANPFGYLSPTRAEDVERILGDRIAYILDGGPCQVGVESTIIDLSKRPFRILRPGKIGREEIEKVLGEEVREWVAAAVVDPQNSAPSEAPGLAPWHYSPKKPLRLWDPENETKPPLDEGTWLFRTRGDAEKGEYTFTQDGNLSIEGVARELYHLLMNADQNPRCKQMIVETPGSETPLHRALTQRLEKAAARYSLP